MAFENYKKWIVIAIIAAAAGIVILAASNSRQKNEAPAPEPSKIGTQAGPMLGPEPVKDASAFPDDPKKLADIGDTYFENQNFEQAAIIYEKLLRLAPGDVDAYNDLALAYLYTGRAEKAVETIKKGTETGPGYQRIWLTQGFILLSLQKQAEAKQSLEKAVKLDPGSSIAKEANRMLGLIKQ